MASFSQEISGKYSVKNYQETKNTYDWIMKALSKGEFKDLEVHANFLFNISDITCSCENIEEFVEHAYGQSNYRFISMHFGIKSKEESLWFISVDYSAKLSISTDTKGMLEKVVSLLRNTSLDETEKDDLISVTYIEHQDNSVTINGDRNIISNNHSTITDKQEKSTSGIAKWTQGICQGILANLMWWILGLVVVMLLSWAVSKGYIST